MLDLGLPDIDGVEVARRLRQWSEAPILILSAQRHEAAKVEATPAHPRYLTTESGVGYRLRG
ncbi:MAG: hypothetical protein MUF34_20850 [Polyangiaceae bacterium]|nr:hypothetical protein [Polyangiaceae bacterium]